MAWTVDMRVNPCILHAVLSQDYYWIPPSIAQGEWTPTTPKRYVGDVDAVTPGQLGRAHWMWAIRKLLRFLKQHTLSSWSLKEALESSDDIGEEVMGHARIQQQAAEQVFRSNWGRPMIGRRRTSNR